MTQTIVRMYGSHEHAMGAVAELKDGGLGDGDIYVVSPPGSPDASLESIADDIAAGYVLKSHAKIYAEGVKRGGTLVIVHAPFGTSVSSTRTLDSYHPIDSGLSEEESEAVYWDDAAPFSSALFSMPTLMKGASPFSMICGLPTLTSGQGSLFGSLGLPEVSSGGSLGPIGLPLLSGNATPLSSLLHLPVLTGK